MATLGNEEILLIAASSIFALYVIYYGLKDNNILMVIFTLMMVFVTVASNRQLFGTEGYVAVQTIIYVMAALGLVAIGYEQYTEKPEGGRSWQEYGSKLYANRQARIAAQKAFNENYKKRVGPGFGYNGPTNGNPA